MVENGEYPADMIRLGKMIENIRYYNTLNYFGFAKYLHECRQAIQ